jgi:acylglycerol lipase
MKHQEGFFEALGGVRLFHQSWLPKGDPKAVLLVVHGLAEHSGRYMNVVDYFVPKRYAVYGIDHVGHGKSEGTRVFVQSFDDYLEPLGTFLEMVKESHPGKPVFLMGHSMGGLIAPLYVLKHKPDLPGMIISAPLTQIPKHVSSMVIVMSKLLSSIVPKLGVEDIDSSTICSDPAVIRAYEEDPLVYRGKTTARLAAELLKEVQHIQKEASKIVMPVLVMQGSEDKLVNPDDGKLFYESVSSSDKTLKIYQGFAHEIFNEPEHDRVFADVEAWLEAHI